jgi:hypothetical protein
MILGTKEGMKTPYFCEIKPVLSFFSAHDKLITHEKGEAEAS